ncbi:LutC/YkgG family protein [Methylobrevis pamukkalensis]|uniref:Lactate utilization protein C n=1 Tax=Methylobrevis pamukkalensis TaxID=1439726 RepID=A0A1E3H5T9_9HYPH|nr:LUD domain-containing protein [Methylobrevis pamukkalensis]ODN71698.1 Lactate utilization protein C [Methylobrevis pamukkalensis]
MSRDAILARMRRSLGVHPGDVTRRAEVADRLTRTPRGVVPARGQLAREELVRLFLDKTVAVQASCVRVASPAESKTAVLDYLRGANLPMRIRIGADRRLAALGLEADPLVEDGHGPSAGDDLACLSHAFGGVAESGTLMLHSGPDNPTTLNFLPDHHIVVVDADDIYGDYETLLDLVRETYGIGEMPRTVNFITGPSRSADIEQTLLLGAHGPRSLHVIVVG